MGRIKKKTCSFFGCPNFNGDDHVYQMFEFPQAGFPGSPQETRLKEWISRCCNPELLVMAPHEVSRSKKSVCFDHFETHQFHDDRRNKLLRGQIPKWNVIHGTPEDSCHYQAPVAEVDIQVGNLDEVQPPPDQPEVAESPAVAPDHGVNGFTPKARKSNKSLLREAGLTSADMTPKKTRLLITTRRLHSSMKRLFREVNRLKQDKKKLSFSMDNEKLWRQVAHTLSPGVQMFVELERKNYGKRPGGRRFDVEARAFCLAIYKRGPRVYRFMKEHIMLPSERSVKGWLARIPLNVGISPVVCKHLKDTVETWDPLDKLCAVVFDEMALRAHLQYMKGKGYVHGFVDIGSLGRQSTVADHALVFMIQGLRKKFKQPFAYYFVKGTISTEDLSQIIVEVVSAVQELGLQVVATVSDQGSTNRAAINKLRKTAGDRGEQDNIFFCNGDEIQHIYDVGHVMKGMRNNFMTANIVTDKGTAKWDDLVDCVTKDRDLFQLLYKVKDKHLNPKDREKMKVSLASQMLSNSMFKTMSTLRETTRNGPAPILQGTEATADVVKTLNDAFDLTNGPSGPRDVKDKRMDVSDTSVHLVEWPVIKRKLSTWKMVKRFGMHKGRTYRPPSLISFVSNVSGFQRLWRTLRERGLKRFRLRALSQDGLENFFGCCRQAGGCNLNPTTIQFEAAFKTAIVNNLSGRSRGQNCEDDGGQLLSNLRHFLTLSEQNREKDPTAQVPRREHRVLGRHEQPLYSMGRLTKTQRLSPSYVMGAIIRRCFQLTRTANCHACKRDLTATADEMSSDHAYIRASEYLADRQALVYPNARAINFMIMGRRNSVKVWDHHGHTMNAKANMIESLQRADELEWVSCTEHKELLTSMLYKVTADFLLNTHTTRVNDRYIEKRRAAPGWRPHDNPREEDEALEE